MRCAEGSHGTLDFNGVAGAISVSTGATFVLQNLDLRGLAAAKSYNYSYYPYLLGTWPGISTQPNSTVRLHPLEIGPAWSLSGWAFIFLCPPHSLVLSLHGLFCRCSIAGCAFSTQWSFRLCDSGNSIQVSRYPRAENPISWGVLAFINPAS